MKKELQQIENLLKEGKITPQEAQSLKAALPQSSTKSRKRTKIGIGMTLILLLSIMVVTLFSQQKQNEEGFQSSELTTLSETILSPTPITLSEMSESKVVGQGEMILKGEKKMLLPLLHTNVVSNIDGFMARVTVKQTFVNPKESTIEALYTFPLPENSAVDSMIMTIGAKRIKGVIKERGEARAIYEEARRAGKTAALLEQERPNIFTQSVANILKNDTIHVTISYIQEVNYANGEFLFNFPMVVGPRYIPGEALKPATNGTGSPTGQVPDANRITPPIVPETHRSGHTISLQVHLNGGTTIEEISSESHKIITTRQSDSSSSVHIVKEDNIPNKDFILKYRLADKKIKNSFLTFKEKEQGYFQLTLLPQLQPKEDDIAPRELIFIVDNSGSMGGFPMDKCRELMTRALTNVRPEDSYNILTFAGSTTELFPQSVPATKANVEKGIAFSQNMRGAGGTEMMKALKQILTLPPVPNQKRILLFLTDAYIGNDQAIISMVRDNLKDSRVFTLGVGSSPNHYVLRSMAFIGGGAYRHIRQDGDAETAINEYYRLIDAPVLTNIKVTINGVETEEVLPEVKPDLFAGAPLLLCGKYKKGGEATITITGDLPKGKKYKTVLKATFPQKESGNSAIRTLWARRKIGEVEIYGGYLFKDNHYTPESVKEEITKLGLQYRLMTQYTSFVAVDDAIRNKDGKWEPMVQAVEIPKGVSHKNQEEHRMASTKKEQVGLPGTWNTQSAHNLGKGRIGIGLGVQGVPYDASYFKGIQKTEPKYYGTSSGKMTGGRSKASIMRVVRRNMEALKEIYLNRLKEKKGLKGKITIKWAIDEFGNVISCKVVSSTINHPTMEKEIVEKIKRWNFGKISNPGDVTEISYPFVFHE